MLLLAILLQAVPTSPASDTIHNHYQLQHGAQYDAEGLPSTFTGLARAGQHAPAAGRMRIDSGDVVESR